MTEEMPEQGEIVMATVSRIMDHGAYVTLDEYGSMQGFLHIGEIAPGWIRSISKFVREGEKKVLLVKKVNRGRRDVDLSLKQVSADQRKKKLLDVKREERGRTLMASVAEKAGLDEAGAEKIEEMLYAKYDSLHEAFMDMAAKGPEAAGKLPEPVAKAVTEVCSKIRLPSVEVRGVMEITNPRPDGVEIIKKALGSAAGEGVEVTYLGAPKYRLGITAPDFKSAERAIKPVISGIQQVVEKKGGSFKFEREESKKTRAA